MAGRISEYIPIVALKGDELMDLSEVNGASPSGYDTVSVTLNEMKAFMDPSFYVADDVLSSNRIVDQDGKYLIFDGGTYFQVDTTNEGIYYDFITRKGGIGTEFPNAKWTVKSDDADPIMELISDVGGMKMQVDNNGNVGIGGVANATKKIEIQGANGMASAVHVNVVSLAANGNGILVTSSSVSGECRGIFSNAIASGGGIAKGVQGTAENALNGTSYGGYYQARNALNLVVGVKGFVPGDSVNPSQHATAVMGENLSSTSDDKRGGYLRLVGDIANGLGYGVKIENAGGGANSNQFGAHVIVDKTGDGTVTKTGAYIEVTGDGTNYALLTNGGNVGFGTVTPSADALVEMASTTQGMILMRMTAIQATAITPANGMMLYVTSTDATFTAVGFWGYEAGAWTKL